MSNTKSERKGFSYRKSAPLRFAMLYLLIGILWILFSDHIVSILVVDTALLTLVQTAKGWFYVIVTAILFYMLIRSDFAALRQSEEKFRALVENSPDIIMRFDRQYRHLYVSPTIEAVVKLSVEDFIGKTHAELGFSEAQAAYWVSSVQSVLDSGKALNQEFVYESAEGHIVFDWRLLPEFGVDGKVQTVLSISRDITARKHAEDALRESLQSSADIVRSIPAGLFIYQYEPPDGLMLLESNPEAERLTGITSQVWYGKHFDEIWPQARANGITQAYLNVMKTGEVYETEEYHYADQRIDGAYRIRVFPMPGQRLGVAFEDVTARKQAEDNLQRSHAEFQEFTRIISHDLQEPLRMISGFLKLLERQYADQLAEDARQYIWYAVDGATRMRVMLEALLEYSRIGTRGKPFVPTDCTTVLEQTLDGLRLLIEEDDAQVTYDTLPTVMADEIQLGRVFQNLVANALKFQPKQEDHQPCVHIRAMPRMAETLDYKPAASAQLSDAEVWLFSVQDNGIGIKKEQVGNLFKVFQRLHTREEYPGTGIGLAACKKIVERHGGQIWVKSEWEQGTTVYFTLPKSQ